MFSERPIRSVELMKLYKDAGWWGERKEQDIEKMLKSESVISIGAWKDGTLIGFARAISDGRFRAYIEDVVIHHAFQKLGIGTNLVSKLLSELSHIDVISLFCEEHLIPFYAKNHFKLSKSQFVMHRK
jgi:N-acetylglutamate synthase-like GNAT family acetyltransferase